MATVTLKQTKCANCGHVQNVEIVENITKELNLSNYNLFKSFNVQRCQNCGYVSNDLEIKRDSYPIVSKILDSNFDFSIELINNSEMYYALLEKEKDFEIIIQLLASIFNVKKRLLSFVLTRSYNTKNPDIINNVKSIQESLYDLATKLLVVVEDETRFKLKEFNNDFIKIFKIELLCVVSKTQTAEEILKSLNIEDEKLLEYLECCIEIGGKLCSNS